MVEILNLRTCCFYEPWELVRFTCIIANFIKWNMQRKTRFFYSVYLYLKSTTHAPYKVQSLFCTHCLKLLIEFYFLVLFWEMSWTPIKIIKAKNIHFFFVVVVVVLVKYLTTLIVVYFC